MSRIVKGYPVFIRLVMCLLVVHIGIFMQAQPTRAGKKITIVANNTPLREILLKVTQQTGYEFVYLNADVNEHERITGRFINQEVDEFLLKLFSGKGLAFSYKGNAITIRKKNESPVNNSRELGDSATVGIISVSGKITDGKGNALPGATIVVKGTQRGVSADSHGQFGFASIPANSTLSVSLIGYEAKEVSLKGSSYISVQLTQAIADLDEAVVVAYNTTTLRSNVGAVTVVKGKEIQNIPNRSFDKSLQGFVPGLFITGGSGQPGAGLSNIVLRGITTGTDANAGQTVRNPLFVIDGVPVNQDNFQTVVGTSKTMITNPMAQLNPSDIESISVLKDAAAIALYGSKASNGVILVTTKRGKAGKPSFNFRHQTDVTTRLKGKTSLLNKEEYLKLLFETYKNTDSDYWTDQRITEDLRKKFPTYKNPLGDTLFYDEQDWNANLFETKAITTSNELALSGGSDNSLYYLNLEYTMQDGVVKSTGYDRKSIRFNFESRPSSAIKLGINSFLSYNKQEYQNIMESASSSFGSGSFMSPLNPIRLNNGEYQLVYPYGSVVRNAKNPVAEAEYNINRNTAYRGLVKFYGDVSFLKYLKLNTLVGADFMLAESKEKVDPRFYIASRAAGLPKILEKDTRRINLITTNTIRFDKTINSNHAVNFIVGQEAQVISDRILRAEARGDEKTLYIYDQLSSPGYVMSYIAGQSNKQTLLSFFGQLNYNYDNKYFLTSSVRWDGSSKFGNQQRWGTYWSVGSGWVVSSENIIKENAAWLSYLKMRGSIGAAGSSAAIGATTRFEVLELYQYYGDNAIVSLPSPGNSTVKWESTFSWDAGFDARVLNDRIGLTVDIYHKKTSDLVYPVTLASVTGYTTVLTNIGNMENKGIEISLTSDFIRSQNFRWRFTGNWSSNRNTLLKANVPLASVSGLLLGNEEGRNFNSFYLREWAGVNRETGMPQWLDEKGSLTSDPSSAVRRFVGKPQPDGFGSITNTFSYKQFELSTVLYYQYGQKIYNSTLSTPYLTDGLFPYVNQVKYAANYWRKPGDNAPNPRRLLNNSDQGNIPSTRYLFDGDYIRLQNVALSYTLSKNLLAPLHLNSLRVFLQVYNIAILTKYDGPDADNVNIEGGTGFAYPNQRSFSLGLNLGF